MKVLDVNVLVGAFHRGAGSHDELRSWLEHTVDSGESIALTPFTVAGFVRVITNPRVFTVPAGISEAWAHIDQLVDEAGARMLGAGERHRQIFARLCADADARGNLVTDAAIAASAIEHSATLVSLDRDFARFPGLRWELPTSTDLGWTS